MPPEHWGRWRPLWVPPTATSAPARDSAWLLKYDLLRVVLCPPVAHRRLAARCRATIPRFSIERCILGGATRDPTWTSFAGDATHSGALKHFVCADVSSVGIFSRANELRSRQSLGKAATQDNRRDHGGVLAIAGPPSSCSRARLDLAARALCRERCQWRAQRPRSAGSIWPCATASAGLAAS